MNIPLGSILRRRLDWPLGALFDHMAILSGPSEVIHFVGWHEKKRRNAHVRRETVDTFAKNRPFHVRAIPQSPEHATEVLQNAETLLGAGPGNQFDGRYNFVSKNCEDFAIRCFGKDKYGPQTQRRNALLMGNDLLIMGLNIARTLANRGLRNAK